MRFLLRAAAVLTVAVCSTPCLAEAPNNCGSEPQFRDYEDEHGNLRGWSNAWDVYTGCMDKAREAAQKAREAELQRQRQQRLADREREKQSKAINDETARIAKDAVAHGGRAAVSSAIGRRLGDLAGGLPGASTTDPTSSKTFDAVDKTITDTYKTGAGGTGIVAAIGETSAYAAVDAATGTLSAFDAAMQRLGGVSADTNVPMDPALAIAERVASGDYGGANSRVHHSGSEASRSSQYGSTTAPAWASTTAASSIPSESFDNIVHRTDARAAAERASAEKLEVAARKATERVKAERAEHAARQAREQQQYAARSAENRDQRDNRDRSSVVAANGKVNGFGYCSAGSNSGNPKFYTSLFAVNNVGEQYGMIAEADSINMKNAFEVWLRRNQPAVQGTGGCQFARDRESLERGMEGDKHGYGLLGTEIRSINWSWDGTDDMDRTYRGSAQ